MCSNKQLVWNRFALHTAGRYMPVLLLVTYGVFIASIELT
jgi:hypothetical protein